MKQILQLIRPFREMRKIAALCLALFLCVGGLWAQTTVTWPGTTALPGTATAVANDQNITIKVSSTNTYTSPIRIYANTTVTISALNDAKILSVNYEASSTGNYVTYAQNATVTPNVTPTVSGNNVTWTYDESDDVTEFTFKPSAQTRSNAITITYIIPGENPTCATPTFSPAAGTYTQAQNVSISCATEDATIYYTTNGNDPTTNSTVYTEAISVSSAMTIKAMAAKSGYDNSAVASAEYAFITLEHAGTLADPYSVADARIAIDANAGTQNVYATGIVSAIPTEWSTQYNNITFNFVDNNGDNVFLQAYRCVSGTGVDASTVAVGDVVVVYGNLTKYGSTYEFGQGCQLVSLTHPVTPFVSVTPATINAPAQGANDTLAITYENIPDLISFDYYFCDANGDELEESIDWIYAEINEEDGAYSISYTIGPNDGEARTAYFKVYTTDVPGNEEVYAIVTVNQEEYVAPTYAELPFSFNSGRADIETTDGLYQEGLGTDYNASTYPNTQLKFDGTGDWLLLQFEERPGTLTFDIKGNGFSGGTFKVQTSENGTTYTDLQTYTSFGSDVESEEFTDLGENVRYIKWIYTNKGNGNVGLGNINLAEYVEPVLVPSITIDPDHIDVNADMHLFEVLPITYENMEISGSGLDVFTTQFYDAEGEAIEDPEWCNAGVILTNGIYQVQILIQANEGEARSAYFKVYAYDANNNPVYSNLVTVNQAAPVIDYAVLPFVWEGGTTSDFDALNGTSVNSVGDYGENQGVYRMKLDADNDYIQVKCDQQPGKVTIGVKMIGGGNTSTITVQGSADGETFTDIEVLTISGDQYDELTLETTNVFGDNDRYVKLLFTKGSNVGVGPITIAKGSAPSITVTPATFNLEAVGQLSNGMQIPSMVVTYHNLEITQASDFDVQFYDAEGEEQDMPDWILHANVSGPINGSYQMYSMINPNEGAARSAYFRVYALDTDENLVYSNLVTINQAAAPQQYNLTVEPFENLELITFVNDEMVMEADGEIQVNDGDHVMLSIVADEGYVMETLIVNGVNHVNDIAADFTYEFDMPAEAVTISATAVEYVAPVGSDYVRITSLDQLTDGSIVVIAARYDEELTNGYYAMSNASSGKPTGVQFTSTTSGDNETLPVSITDDGDDYYWTVNVTENGYTFTNAEGDMIGYGTSGTNFVTGGTNTEWTIESGTAGNSAMVAGYTGFVIKNYTTNARAFAFNGSAFGPYATSNMAAANYNFFLDFFVESGETPGPDSCPKISLNEANNYTYFQNFDSLTTSTEKWTGTTMGDCWTWTRTVDLPEGYLDTVPQVYYNSNFAQSKPYSLRLHFRGVYAMPELDENININQLKMSFWSRHSYPFYTLMVGVMDDPTAPETFVPVAYVDNGSSTSSEYFEFDFSKYQGEGRYIAFKNVRPSNTAFDGEWADIHSVNYIDDITLSLMEEVPTCVVEVPYTNNFDNVTTSTSLMTGATPECWELVQKDVEMPLEKMPQVYYKHSLANSGNYSLRLTNRGVFAMPSFGNVDLSTLQLSMYVRQPNARYQLQVGVWDGQAFTPVALVNNESTSYEEFVCDFSNYDGQGGRIAFRNVLSAGGNLDYSINYIDDIVISSGDDTPCTAVTMLNDVETFENFTNSTVNATGVKPTCWEVVQKDVDMAYDKYPQVYYNPNFGQGSYTLRLADRCVFAMPELEDGINLNEVTLTMTLRQPNTQYQLEVGVWEFGYDENQEPVEQFVPVATFHNSDNSVTEVSCDFASYTGTGNRVAFRNTLKTSNYNYSYNYLDDITLTLTESKIAENSSANVIDEIGVERYLEGIVVYPNPTVGELHIGAVDVQKVECYNQMGQLVAVYNNTRDINISALADGVYTLRITVPQGVTMRKVVKK